MGSIELSTDDDKQGELMSAIRRIVKNAGLLFVSQVISRLLAFFYVMYTARYLGAKGFGILSFALAFTGIFGVLADLGLGQLTIREVARNKSLAGKYITNISVIKVILATITFGLIVLVINLLGYPEQTIKVVYIIALSVIFSAFTGMFNSVFQAFEKMEYVSLGRILNSVLIFIGVFFAIEHSFGVVGFSSLYLMANIIVLCYSLVVFQWGFGSKVFTASNKLLEIDWSFWKQIIKKALPFGLSAIFVTIYFRIDSVMLSLLKSNEAVGWYSAAYKIVDVFTSFVPGVIYAVAYPIYSRHFKSKDLKYIYIRSFKVSLILGFFISVSITLFANKIIAVLYGAQYIKSISALKILIWAFFIICISTVTSGLLNSIDKQNIVTIGTGIGAVLNIVLNFILIPKYNLNGAALATVFTELFGFSLYFYFVVKFVKVKFSNIFLWRKIL